MATKVTILGPQDQWLFARVADGVFDHALRPVLCEEFLADARHHLAGAIDDDDDDDHDGGVIVGMASGVHYVHPDKPAELWINEVGVAPAHRGRGVGRWLVNALLDVGRQFGCTEAWVLTDRGNDAAMRLYASCGGREAEPQPVMFNFRIDELDQRGAT